MMPDIQVYYLQHLYLENSPEKAPGIDAIHLIFLPTRTSCRVYFNIEIETMCGDLTKSSGIVLIV